MLGLADDVAVRREFVAADGLYRVRLAVQLAGLRLVGGVYVIDMHPAVNGLRTVCYDLESGMPAHATTSSCPTGPGSSMMSGVVEALPSTCIVVVQWKSIGNPSGFEYRIVIAPVSSSLVRSKVIGICSEDV